MQSALSWTTLKSMLAKNAKRAGEKNFVFIDFILEFLFNIDGSNANFQNKNNLNEALGYFDLMLINTEKLRKEYNSQNSKENISPWLRSLYEEAILCYLESYKKEPNVDVLSKITKLVESCKSIILSDALKLENTLKSVEIPDSILNESKRLSSAEKIHNQATFNIGAVFNL